MEEILRDFIPDWNPKPLIPITYICHVCATEIIRYEPRPRELENKDFRQWCWQCKMIQHHIRTIKTS